VGVIDRLQETWYRATGQAELAEQLSAERQTATYLQETLADLEARMYEPGWQRMTAYADQEFSRPGPAPHHRRLPDHGAQESADQTRSRAPAGVRVGSGRRDHRPRRHRQRGHPGVPGRPRQPPHRLRRAGLRELERSLGTDGNVFIACFTSPKTGRVQVRVLPWDEIGDIITNPEDSSEPWFYRRESWTERTDQRSGGIIQERRLVYYPALGYRPAARPPMVWDVHGGGLVDVMWDAPVLHVKVNGLQGWKFGVPDAYAAIDWANAYKEFLTDWATLIKALSRFAWRLTSKGTKQAAAKAKLSAAPSADPYTGERRHAGATASLPPDMASRPCRSPVRRSTQRVRAAARRDGRRGDGRARHDAPRRPGHHRRPRDRRDPRHPDRAGRRPTPRRCGPTPVRRSSTTSSKSPSAPPMAS
jgi:hypothetical protein